MTDQELTEVKFTLKQLAESHRKSAQHFLTEWQKTKLPLDGEMYQVNTASALAYEKCLYMLEG